MKTSKKNINKTNKNRFFFLRKQIKKIKVKKRKKELPTVNGKNRRFEVHIFDFKSSLGLGSVPVCARGSYASRRSDLNKIRPCTTKLGAKKVRTGHPKLTQKQLLMSPVLYYPFKLFSPFFWKILYLLSPVTFAPSARFCSY